MLGGQHPRRMDPGTSTEAKSSKAILGDVAVHVEQAECIGRILADNRWPAQGSFTGWRLIGAEIRLLERNGFAGVVLIRRARTASAQPFIFGWQAIKPAVLSFSFQLGQSLTVILSRL